MTSAEIIREASEAKMIEIFLNIYAVLNHVAPGVLVKRRYVCTCCKVATVHVYLETKLRKARWRSDRGVREKSFNYDIYVCVACGNSAFAVVREKALLAA